ncbi:hypothetical protein H4R99_002675 [Coemansia sp. RSA 1722]|nr:hypothetical protein H4R99_002675 [Coemansia sp. RSA 1722]KAJ2696539.1 hypothetical protein FB645_006173 [Coemansia sp. IMI 203386]
MSELPGFTLPTVFDNPKGWGPSNSKPSNVFKDIPYIPFSKGDKVTRVANWINPNENRDMRDGGRGRRQRDAGHQAYGSGTAAAFVYAADEDEESFSLVDNRGTAMRKIAVRAVQGGPRSGHSGSGARGRGRGGMQRLGQAGNRFGGFRRRYGWRDAAASQRSASVIAGDDWEEIHEIQFSRMRDLSFDPKDAQDVGMYGSTGIWDHTLDRLSVRMDKTITASPVPRFNVSASDDPVLAEIADKNSNVKVLATDTVVAALMAAMVSNSAWDIVVNRVGDRVFFDKRDGGPLDFAPVNENASPPPASEPKDATSLNGAAMLAREARDATRSLISQSTASKTIELERKNPFSDDEEKDFNAYRYRTFDLNTEEGEQPCLIAVRTEVDGMTAEKTPRQLFIRALTQHDISATGAGGVLDWRSRLDTQRGAIMATEMINNAGKLSRWAFQALLSGADQMKIGYIVRSNPRDSSRHTVLGFQSYRPLEFIANLGLSEYNAWGIVKALVDLCLDLEEGRYVIMRDPNNPLIRIYSVPAGTFDETNEKPKEEADNDDEADMI